MIYGDIPREDDDVDKRSRINVDVLLRLFCNSRRKSSRQWWTAAIPSIMSNDVDVGVGVAVSDTLRNGP